MTGSAYGKRIAAWAGWATLALALASAAPTAATEAEEGMLIKNLRQMIFEGKRSGEGYFSRDGAQMVFQSEREPGNPFYQIYLMDLGTGDTRRMSTGVGKTTCAWIHPSEEKVLFASTHLDPEAIDKQRQELEERASGTSRRYSWSFDPHYDIFETPSAGGELVNLTNAFGYDAEGAWSPDGAHILFASNRSAYAGTLSEEEREILGRDPSYFMDLYVMNADGSNVRRLTDTPGYDGGPFYSHDGRKIVWRRFTPDGGSAEIYTMNADGSDLKVITRLGAMSWAPFFHPSGDYVIFATSVLGFRNFELYMVDAEGAREPVRVTYSEGFDGLPVFSPDGKTLSWSSARTPDKRPQIFVAEWDDAKARRLLGLESAEQEGERKDEVIALPETRAAIDAKDLRAHVTTLASEWMEGRLTGSPGERRAADYVAGVFEALGLEPAGDDGGYLQGFDFTAAVSLGSGNRLKIETLDQALAVDRDWRPLGLSANGTTGPGEVVFAGYGIVAPAEGEHEAYNSYGDFDVTGKWVLVLRYLPEGISQERRQHLYRYAELNYKAAIARVRGALGLIVASGPRATVKNQLVPLSYEAAAAGSRLAGISVTDQVAEAMLEASGRRLGELQEALDTGEILEGVALPGVSVNAVVDLDQQTARGHNVLARLPAGADGAAPAVIVGGHIDHLGRGIEGKSRARPEERDEVHYGADDNASGVAAMLEIAQYLAHLKKEGKLALKRDVLFAGWSGEELGMLGSTHFTRRLASSGEAVGLGAQVAGYINLDMVGRLESEELILQGVGSSSVWLREIERRNVVVGLDIVTNDSPFMATDATAFYLKGVPVLNAFTGAHDQYSTPRDTPDTLDYEGMQRVAHLVALIARSLATSEAAPEFVHLEATGDSPRRRTSRVYLGTIPDYAQTEGQGARISGVAKGGPAEAAGLQSGDRVIEMAGREIENIYDYSHALDSLKAGRLVDMVVLRDGQRLRLTITPEARE